MTENAEWTNWLANPGTGECPVPGWAETLEVRLKSGKQQRGSRNFWDWSASNQAPITHYRYAIPATLADLARSEVYEEPHHYEGGTVMYEQDGLVSGWSTCHPDSMIAKRHNRNLWTNHDRDRARRDLGLDTAPTFEPATPNAAHGNDDPVHHPSHYMLAPELEAIDVIRAALTPTEYMGYLKGSILKYRLRAGRKGKAEQDIAKSDWYRERALAERGDT